MRLHLRVQRAQLGTCRQFAQFDRVALGERAMLLQRQVLESHAGLDQQVLDRGAMFERHLLGISEPRRPGRRPLERDRAHERAFEAGLDRCADFIGIRRAEQLVAC